MGVALVMFTQNGERRDFPISASKATVGRDGGCDIQISLAVVSRQHCELTIANGQVALRDLGSSNGTYVNNKRVQQAQLHPGDTLSVGPVVFTVVIDNQPQEIKPIRTVLEASNNKKTAPPASPRTDAAPKKPDDTGRIDLNNLGELDLAKADASASDSGSIA